VRCVVKTFSTGPSVTCGNEPFQRSPSVARELPIVPESQAVHVIIGTRVRKEWRC